MCLDLDLILAELLGGWAGLEHAVLSLYYGNLLSFLTVLTGV